MAQLACDKLVVPLATDASSTASSNVLGSPSALVLTGHSPNKASAALTLSSLFRSTATAAAPNPNVPTAFITPLDKSTHLKRQVHNASEFVGAHAPAGPTIVTAPANKKARHEREVVHAIRPYYGPHGSDGNPQFQPAIVDRTHLNQHNDTTDRISTEDTSPPLPPTDGYDYAVFADVPFSVTQPQFFFTAAPQSFIQYYPADPMHPLNHAAPSSYPSNAAVAMVPSSSSSPPNMHRSMSQANLDETAQPRQQSQPHLASPLNGILSINSAPFSPPPPPPHYAQPSSANAASLPPSTSRIPNGNLGGSNGCVMLPHTVYYFHGHPLHPFSHGGNPQWMPPNSSSAFYAPMAAMPPDMRRAMSTGTNATFIPIQPSQTVMEAAPAPMQTQPSRKKGRSNKSQPKLIAKVSSTPEEDVSLEKSPYYNRKEKSLGLLSENFIAIFSSLPPATTMDAETSSTLICIDQAASHLGVERRRIYDIVNVLESLKIVSRKCKNTYYWHGTQDLMDTFADLQEEALFGNMNVSCPDSDVNLSQTTLESEPSLALGQVSCGYGVEEALKSGLISASSYLDGLQSTYMGTQEQLNDETTLDNAPNMGSSRVPAKCKTLAKLSQRFVQYFLMGHIEVSLIDSSEQILGFNADSPDLMDSQGLDSVDEGAKTTRRSMDLTTLKSKIRRLYDVANVFTSLKIIEKKNTGNNFSSVESFRPSFKWCWELTPREILDRRISNKTARNMTVPEGNNGR